MTVATDHPMPDEAPEEEARRKVEARRRYWGSPEERHLPLPEDALEAPQATPAPPGSPAHLTPATPTPEPMRRRADGSGAIAPAPAREDRSGAGYWGSPFTGAPDHGVAPDRPEVSEANLAARLRAAAAAPPVGLPVPSRSADEDAPPAARAAASRTPRPGSLLGEAFGALVIAVPSGMVAGLTCLVLSHEFWRLASELARQRPGLVNLTYLLVFAFFGVISGQMAPRAWPVAAIIGWMPLWASLLAFPQLQAGLLPATRPERLLLVTLWAAPLVAMVGALLGSMGSLLPPVPPPED